MVPRTKVAVIGWIKGKTNKWWCSSVFFPLTSNSIFKVFFALEFWHSPLLQGQLLLYEFICFIGQPHGVIWRSVKVVFIILGDAYHFLLRLYECTLIFLIKVCFCLHRQDFLIFNIYLNVHQDCFCKTGPSFACTKKMTLVS